QLSTFNFRFKFQPALNFPRCRTISTTHDYQRTVTTQVNLTHNKGIHMAFEIQKATIGSRNIIVTALAVAIAGMTGTTEAQQSPAIELEEVVITGSRIRASGMETPTPVTSVDSLELATMAPGNMIDSLSQLPLFLNNATPQTQFNFSGSAGASNLNLRGVGS